MIMSFVRLSLLFSFLLVGAASAALVNISTNTLSPPARNVVTSDGTPLPIGNAIRIGTFPAGAPVISGTSTFASVNSLFVPMGEDLVDPADGTTAPLLTTGAGTYAGTISAVNNSDARFPENRAIYIFVMDAAYANLGAATEWAIFRDPLWTIPGTGTRAMTTSQIDSQSEMVVGTWSSGSIRMAAIPEPSGLFLVIGSLPLLMRRCRRH